MIESIQSAVITLPNINQDVDPIALKTADSSAVTKFDSILQKAESSNLTSFQYGNNPPVNNGILDKLLTANKNYNSIKSNAIDIGNILAPKDISKKEISTIRTVDNNKHRTNMDIRTNTSDNGISQIEKALQDSITELKELKKSKKLVNQKFMEMRVWSTNMAIFSAIVKNVSTGFKTLFRSSG